MLPAHSQHSRLLSSDRETGGERRASSLDSTLSSSTMEGEKTEGEATGKLPELSLPYPASLTAFKHTNSHKARICLKRLFTRAVQYINS